MMQRTAKESTVKQKVLSAVLAIFLLLAVGLFGASCSESNSSDENNESVSSASESSASAGNIDDSTHDATSVDDGISENEEGDQGNTSQNSASQATVEDRYVQRLLDSMTLEEKVAQLFILSPEELTGVSEVTQAGDTTKEALETYPVGGLIYFGPNLVNAEQTTEMLANTQSYAKYGMFLCVDEEGGPLVARIGNNDGFSVPQFPSMQKIGESGDVEEAYEVGDVIGGYLSELGFNVDFAPIADVLTNPDNESIGSRSFGSDPQLDGEMVAQVVEGLQENNVVSVLKHFPGHGDTEGDSHENTVVNNRTLEELTDTEFVPFEAGIDAGAACVMIGHISLPQVTNDDTPATLSSDIVTGLLRDQLGFEGVVIADSMSMGAISNYHSSADAAVKAIDAGCDMLLTPENFQEAYQGILDAVSNKTLSEERINESVQRILRCKVEFGIISTEEN